MRIVIGQRTNVEMAGDLSDAQRGSGLGCLLGGRGVVAKDIAFDLVSEGRIVRVRGQRD